MTITCTNFPDSPVDSDYIKSHHLFPEGWKNTHVHKDLDRPDVLIYCTAPLKGTL